MEQEQDKRMLSSDPMDHATAFCDTFEGRKVVQYGDQDIVGIDPGIVVGWFANVMTVGERKGHEDAVRAHLIRDTEHDLDVAEGTDQLFDYDKEEGKPSTGSLKLVFLVALGNWIGWAPLVVLYFLIRP